MYIRMCVCIYVHVHTYVRMYNNVSEIRIRRVLPGNLNRL